MERWDEIKTKKVGLVSLIACPSMWIAMAFMFLFLPHQDQQTSSAGRGTAALRYTKY